MIPVTDFNLFASFRDMLKAQVYLMAGIILVWYVSCVNGFVTHQNHSSQVWDLALYSSRAIAVLLVLSNVSLTTPTTRNADSRAGYYREMVFGKSV